MQIDLIDLLRNKKLSQEEIESLIIEAMAQSIERSPYRD
jgi:hypothetical protein